MKTLLPWAFTFLLIGPANLIAQPAPPRVAIHAPNGPGSPAERTLPTNYRLQLKEATKDGNFLDIAVTGIGPAFNAQSVEPRTVFSGTITERDGNFIVAYGIGRQVKLETSKGNYEYRDTSMNGTVELTPGKPVSIAQINGSEFTLEIEQAVPAK